MCLMIFSVFCSSEESGKCVAGSLSIQSVFFLIIFGSMNHIKKVCTIIKPIPAPKNSHSQLQDSPSKISWPQALVSIRKISINLGVTNSPFNKVLHQWHFEMVEIQSFRPSAGNTASHFSRFIVGYFTN